MRALIADDHPFIRKGIRETLSEELGFQAIREFSDGAAAYDALLSENFDIAIVDISMPGKGGLELIKDVLAARPDTRFLVMSVFPERDFAERAYRSGARGYLDKASPPEEFVEAVRRIVRGKSYVSRDYAETLLHHLGSAPSDAQRLTDREDSVVRLYASGKKLSEIGAALNLSVKTVSTYKVRAMEKLGVENNAELLIFVRGQGLSGKPDQ